MTDHDGDWYSLGLLIDEFADLAHEQRLRFGAEADPAVVVVGQIVRIGTVLRFEHGDVWLFVAVIGDAFGIGVRVVADVVGADPIEEQAVDVIIGE